MKIGYARVSTDGQTLESQIDLLEKHGCKKIFSDKYTGSSFNRENLNEMLKYLRDEEDELIIYVYDRLGRNTEESIKVVKELVLKRKIKVISLSDSRQYDFNNAADTLNFEIGRAVDSYHNNKNRERLRYAREAGRVGGRPKKLTEEDKKLMTNMYLSNEVSISNICKRFNIGESTFYDNIKVGELMEKSGRKVGRKVGSKKIKVYN